MILRSVPYNWTAGATLTFPLNFVDPTRSMRAPVIKSIGLRCVMTYNTGTSGGPARLLPQVLTRIRVADGSKDRINVRGSTARIINQVEFGAAYQDGTNTAASQSNVTQEFILNFPCNPWKSRRRNDYGIPLFELVDGGALELAINSNATPYANYHTYTAGTFQWFFNVDETRSREGKSRMCYRDVDIAQTEFQVPIGGALRWFAFYYGEVGETTQAALAAQNFTSQTLEYSVIPREVLRNQYRIEQLSAIRTADAGSAIAAEDVFALMQAVMLLMVDEDAKIPEMPQLASLHVQTDGSITTANLPKYIYSYIADRDPALLARTLGASSPAQLQAGLQTQGFVKTASHKSSPIGHWSPDTVRAMPVKLRTKTASGA
jgi:hypothetical protein